MKFMAVIGQPGKKDFNRSFETAKDATKEQILEAANAKCRQGSGQEILGIQIFLPNGNRPEIWHCDGEDGWHRQFTETWLNFARSVEK